MQRRSSRSDNDRPWHTWRQTRRSFLRIAPTLPLLALAATGYADEGWRHWKTEDRVAIHYRTLEPSGLTEVRADTSVRCSLSAFVNLLRDTDHADRWLDRVTSVEELERYSETENLVETHVKGFMMVAQRWVLTRSTLAQDENLRLTMRVRNEYREDLHKPGIQVRRLEALWTLTPLEDGQVHIRYQGIIDPDGGIPGWMVHNLNLESTFNTFVNLRQRIRMPRYQQPQIPFITEP